MYYSPALTSRVRPLRFYRGNPIAAKLQSIVVAWLQLILGLRTENSNLKKEFDTKNDYLFPMKTQVMKVSRQVSKR